MEAGSSAKRKDADFHVFTLARGTVARGFNETMNYILCGGSPEYPPRRREKSWSNVVSRQVDDHSQVVPTLLNSRMDSFVVHASSWRNRQRVPSHRSVRFLTRCSSIVGRSCARVHENSIVPFTPKSAHRPFASLGRLFKHFSSLVRLV